MVDDESELDADGHLIHAHSLFALQRLFRFCRMYNVQRLRMASTHRPCTRARARTRAR
jgi:hypothetical protein